MPIERERADNWMRERIESFSLKERVTSEAMAKIAPIHRARCTHSVSDFSNHHHHHTERERVSVERRKQ